MHFLAVATYSPFISSCQNTSVESYACWPPWVFSIFLMNRFSSCACSISSESCAKNVTVCLFFSFFPCSLWQHTHHAGLFNGTQIDHLPLHVFLPSSFKHQSAMATTVCTLDHSAGRNTAVSKKETPFNAPNSTFKGKLWTFSKALLWKDFRKTKRYWLMFLCGLKLISRD